MGLWVQNFVRELAHLVIFAVNVVLCALGKNSKLGLLSQSEAAVSIKISVSFTDCGYKMIK